MMTNRPFSIAGQVSGNAGIPAVPWTQPGQQQQPMYDQYNAGGNM